MKKIGLLTAYIVIFIVAGLLFISLPRSITPGAPKPTPDVICYTNANPIYKPTKTIKRGFPLTYTIYEGSPCPPPSPDNIKSPITDFIFGGLLVAAAVKVLVSRRKR
jgi:hypothetical protein